MKSLLTFVCLTLFVSSNTSGQITAHQAKKMVKNGDLITLSGLISNGLDINTTFGRNYTLLHYAARYGKYDIATFLVENGADLDVQIKRDKWTPLIISTMENDDSISQLLILSGANPNVAGNSGTTALRNTIGFWGYGGNPKLFKLLIDNGADLTFQCGDCCNRTIFLYCCAWGTPEMLQLLLDKNVDVNVADCKGVNGLMGAIQTKNKEAIQLLLATDIDLSHLDNKGKSILDYALSTKDQEIIDLIHDKIK